MEAIAAFGLVGLGYLVTKLSENKEGFQENPVSRNSARKHFTILTPS